MADPVYNMAGDDLDASYKLFWDGRFLNQIVEDSIRSR